MIPELNLLWKKQKERLGLRSMTSLNHHLKLLTENLWMKAINLRDQMPWKNILPQSRVLKLVPRTWIHLARKQFQWLKLREEKNLIREELMKKKLRKKKLKELRIKTSWKELYKNHSQPNLLDNLHLKWLQHKSNLWKRTKRE